MDVDFWKKAVYAPNPQPNKSFPCARGRSTEIWKSNMRVVSLLLTAFISTVGYAGPRNGQMDCVSFDTLQIARANLVFQALSFSEFVAQALLNTAVDSEVIKPRELKTESDGVRTCEAVLKISNGALSEELPFSYTVKDPNDPRNSHVVDIIGGPGFSVATAVAKLMNNPDAAGVPNFVRVEEIRYGTSPTKNGMSLISIAITNQSNEVRTFPDLNLRWTDDANLIVTELHFGPLEYLSDPSNMSQGMKPGPRYATAVEVPDLGNTPLHFHFEFLAQGTKIQE